jgi:hypothetical protein
MAFGRPIAVLTLSDDEHDRLERWARRPTTAQASAQCARLVLACARGRTNTRVARELRLTTQTVGKWRSRFVDARLDGLRDEPRPGNPTTYQRRSGSAATGGRRTSPMRGSTR